MEGITTNSDIGAATKAVGEISCLVAFCCNFCSMIIAFDSWCAQGTQFVVSLCRYDTITHVPQPTVEKQQAVLKSQWEAFQQQHQFEIFMKEAEEMVNQEDKRRTDALLRAQKEQEKLALQLQQQFKQQSELLEKQKKQFEEEIKALQAAKEEQKKKEEELKAQEQVVETQKQIQQSVSQSTILAKLTGPLSPLHSIITSINPPPPPSIDASTVELLNAWNYWQTLQPEPTMEILQERWTLFRKYYETQPLQPPQPT